MKNFLILTAVLTVIFVAFIDTKARIEELDSIAATTQVQVERDPGVNKSSGDGIMQKFETMEQPEINKQISPKEMPLQTPQDNLSPRPQNKFRPVQPDNYMP